MFVTKTTFYNNFFYNKRSNVSSSLPHDRRLHMWKVEHLVQNKLGSNRRLFLSVDLAERFISCEAGFLPLLRFQ
jgi:hypothetical protein